MYLKTDVWYQTSPLDYQSAWRCTAHYYREGRGGDLASEEHSLFLPRPARESARNPNIKLSLTRFHSQAYARKEAMSFCRKKSCVRQCWELGEPKGSKGRNPSFAAASHNTLQLRCLRESSPCTLHFTSFTPHPTPQTSDPTPFTPHPTPYTLHPTPYTPHPTPVGFRRCLLLLIFFGRIRQSVPFWPKTVMHKKVKARFLRHSGGKRQSELDSSGVPAPAEAALSRPRLCL